MRRYRTVIVMVLLGVVPLIVALVAARFFLTDEKPTPAPAVVQEPAPAPKPPEMRRVVVAARALTIGTLLGENDLNELEMAPEAVRRGHIVVEGTVTVEALRGYAVRETVAMGAPLTRAAVVGPRQRGFLATVLKPGTGAFTIELDAGASHAGLIDPGDRVDVILTAELQTGDDIQTVLTRTILRDVRVVAIDSRLGGRPEDAESDDRSIQTATLEVSPAQAGALALARHQGTLSLAVRSLVAGPSAPHPDAAMELRDLLFPPASPVAQEPAEPRGVVVAARALTIGTLLGEDDLIELEMAPEAVEQGHIVVEGTVTVDALRGYAVREAVVMGAPLTWAAVVGPGQHGFLATVLKPGTGAFTIELDGGDSYAGLIAPGDRVDVILTAELKSPEGDEGLHAGTILEDVRVVAADRRVAGAQAGNGEQADTAIVTATLEVLPFQADRLALAKKGGTISLAVRSLSSDPAGRRGAVVKLSDLLPQVPVVEETKKVVRVIRGDKVTEETFPTTAMEEDRSESQ